MASRDDDESEDIEEKPRPKRPRPEGVQPAKPRRPQPPPDDDEYDEDDRPRRRARRDELRRAESRREESRRDEEDEDYEDDRPRRRKRGGAIIPYRNGMALAAYYCGFGGLIFILGSFALAAFIAVRTEGSVSGLLIGALLYGGGGICALLAVIFGIVGWIRASRNPEARGTAHAIIGIVLGGLEIVGLVAITLIGMMVAR